MIDQNIHMKGGGYYSANTMGAKHVVDRAGKLIDETIDRVNFQPAGRSFNIVDYGAADGGTSLDLVRKIVSKVRRKAPSQQISVTYTDLPHNDFSSLFRMLHGQVDGVSGYLSDFPEVFVSGAGTTFYKQIVPDSSVDIGFSATAMHWLSRMPGAIDDHVHAVGAKDEQWRVFRNFALADWERILIHRSAEMAPGALLVMANFCIDEQGRYLGSTRSANMFDSFNCLWSDMAAEGLIEELEYQATVFPQFYKTLEEFRAPFDDPQSAVSRSGLQLETVFTGLIECPYRAEFDRVGDPASFAEAYVPTLRSWSENVFFSGLSSKRPVQERRELVEEFYARYVDLVRQEPNRHAMDYVHAYMSVIKAG